MNGFNRNNDASVVARFQINCVRGVFIFNFLDSKWENFRFTVFTFGISCGS